MIVLAWPKMTDLLQLEVDYLNTLEFHLFANDIDPDPNTVETDFDEPTDGGYAPAVLGTFSLAVVGVFPTVETVGEPWTVTFLHDDGDQTIYGYYVTDPADGDALVYSERAPDPFEVTVAFATYTVVPKKIMRAITEL